MNKKLTLLNERLKSFNELAKNCEMCVRACKVNRLKGEKGGCESTFMKIASHTLHFGEEPFISGQKGSGTIFFSNCTMKCVYCQNHEISQEGVGKETNANELAKMMLSLQEKGAENINLVTPTHYIHEIAKGLIIAYEKGLDIPIVYNTNGYDSVKTLKLLSGIVDVYLPDMKYQNDEYSYKYSKSLDYTNGAKEGILEMYKQVEEKFAKRLVIRHLVLPNNISGSYDFLIWLNDMKVSNVTLSIMCQYSPQFKAKEYEKINLKISEKEYENIIEYAEENTDVSEILRQEFTSVGYYLPDFKKDKPFEE